MSEHDEAISAAKALLRAEGYEIVRKDRIVKVEARQCYGIHMEYAKSEPFIQGLRRANIRTIGEEIARTEAVVWSEFDGMTPHGKFADIAVRDPRTGLLEFKPNQQRVIRAEVCVLIPKPAKA